MKNIFSKFLTNKNTRSRLSIGNQNEFSGIISEAIPVENTVKNLQDANVDNLTYIANAETVNTTTKLLEVSESGSYVILNKADGVTILLPQPQIGLIYEFFIATSVTSNAYTVIAQDATITGFLINIDTDTSNALDAFTADGTTHVAVTMNGTSTGGLRGTTFKLTCISNNMWLINGTNIGSTVVESPFVTE